MQLISKYFFLALLLVATQLGYTQFVVDNEVLDSINEIKEVKPIEANFLFSYYEQDGTKSPVTGGIGDEALKDRVGNISLNIPISNRIEFSFLGGVDMYSSASTDNIDNEHGLFTETSASYSDTRIYGDLGVLFNNEKKRFSYGVGIGVSHEFDVISYNLNTSFSKLSKNRNTLFYVKASAYNDKWKLLYPSELRWKYNDLNGEKNENEVDESENDDDGGSDIRNTFNGLISIEQDINPRMNMSITVESTYQNGLLSTPFHRVYFIDSRNHDIEKLPSNRLKIPIGIRLNYYINQFMITRLFYRYYFDDFGVKGHTFSVELPIKPIKNIAIAPFYRYHTQVASKYFKPYGFHSVEDNFYTSDFDLADIESNRVGLELRFSPTVKNTENNNKKRITFKKITLRGSKYYRFRQDELILKSYIVALALNFRIE